MYTPSRKTKKMFQMSSDEVPFILKYMYNSNGAKDMKVDLIFRVAVTEDSNKASRYH